ncbi:MAG: DUF1059 domain-containing protein [Actinomycetota bacterium]|nr:DUF1059 domain-containing protein [Actinomycetota bacterium]
MLLATSIDNVAAASDGLAWRSPDCRDAGFDCNDVVHGDTVEEIMAQVRPHAASAHGVQVDETLERQLQPLVHEG